jgi:hypothetical protein
MLNFLKSKPVAAPPEPIEREGELLSRLHLIDDTLKVLHDTARDFQREHKVMIDGVSAWRVENVKDRAALEMEWRDMSNKCAKLIRERNGTLHKWATLKVEREAQHV